MSGVCVVVETEKIPIAPCARGVAAALGLNPLEWALTGGEDFELLLAVAPQELESVRQALLACGGAPLTVIGRCEPGQGVRFIGLTAEQGESLRGYDHFASP